MYFKVILGQVNARALSRPRSRFTGSRAGRTFYNIAMGKNKIPVGKVFWKRMAFLDDIYRR